jgi:hypothetical protein
VFVRFIGVAGFTSFGQPAQLDLDDGLTVVTGPNGAGKTNLGSSLDVLRCVLADHGTSDSERLSLYEGAAFDGADAFTIKVGVDFDQPHERALVSSYVKAAYLTSRTDVKADSMASFEQSWEWFDEGSLTALLSGTVVIRCRQAMARHWSADWELTDGAGRAWRVGLRGDGTDRLRPGEPGSRPATGAVLFADWLLESKPQTEAVLNFGKALENAKSEAAFSVNPQSGLQGTAEASAREFAALLGVAADNRSFSFRQVIGMIVRQGVVLTDNRRLPMSRRFPFSSLAGPFDPRDGTDVPAELFRLKNGVPRERHRFTEIQATFRGLTGRELEVRAAPASDSDDEPALLIDPVVRGGHSERLVRASGAGIQEALVLSTLLHGTPGRITVLDEPAVNLEPTVQRRLLSQVRGPGQYLLITHSADLVPFEEPGDLPRIVRVAPGPDGSQLRRPTRGDAVTRDHFKQLRFMEPAEVRSLLFARAVVLCEGETEAGAFPRWWASAYPPGQQGLATANVPFISVGGHLGFGRYVKFLDTYAIPWAIVADGPALRRSSALYTDLLKRGRWPGRPEPAGNDGFPLWAKFWEATGVLTLARDFGDAGGKEGEIEVFLGTVDADLLAEAMRETGHSKARAGSYFAAGHPQPPVEVSDLFEKIVRHLRLA